MYRKGMIQVFRARSVYGRSWRYQTGKLVLCSFNKHQLWHHFWRSKL